MVTVGVVLVVAAGGFVAVVDAGSEGLFSTTTGGLVAGAGVDVTVAGGFVLAGGFAGGLVVARGFAGGLVLAGGFAGGLVVAGGFTGGLVVAGVAALLDAGG
jgi:hypothetical protein